MKNNAKLKFEPLSDIEEGIGRKIVRSAIKIHRELGPGLLEKIYEICLAHELEKAGFSVKRQSYMPITYDKMTFKEGLRLDLLVNELVVVEIKAVENVNPRLAGPSSKPFEVILFTIRLSSQLYCAIDEAGD